MAGVTLLVLYCQLQISRAALLMFTLALAPLIVPHGPSASAPPAMATAHWIKRRAPARGVSHPIALRVLGSRNGGLSPLVVGSSPVMLHLVQTEDAG